MPKPRLRTFVIALLCLWDVLVVAGVVHVRLLQPTGDGFTRGMNRLLAGFGWTGAATFVATAAWLVGRKVPRGGLRRASLAPIMLHLLAILALGGLVVWVGYLGG